MCVLDILWSGKHRRAGYTNVDGDKATQQRLQVLLSIFIDVGFLSFESTGLILTDARVRSKSCQKGSKVTWGHFNTFIDLSGDTTLENRK